MSGRWFRFYDAVLDDPKVQRLTPEQFRLWANLLCLANRNDGRLPKPEDAAFSLRMPVAEYGQMLRDLVHAGLFDKCDGTWEPHNWASRQYKSDSSADRMRRHRDRHRDVTPTVTVTRSEADTETEAETERVGGADAPPTKPKRAMRLPDDWTVSEAGRAYANGLGLNPDKIAEAFVDYWRAQGGANARKLDWDAAYRTWCRRAHDDQPKASTPRTNGFAKPAPSTMPSDEPWEARMNGWRDKRFWMPAIWGPPPGEAGCRVPKGLRGDA